jgi:hypothetical protein
MENLKALKQKKPPQPPATLTMLAALQIGLDLQDPFVAAIWAICACAFWGLMQFGEVTVKHRAEFSPAVHAAQGHVCFSCDQLGHPYACITLPIAKTAAARQTQDIFLLQQSGPLCPVEALVNLA